MNKRRKTEDMEPMDLVTTTTKKRKYSGSTPIPRSIKQYVNRAVNRSEEVKYFDTAINNTASSVSFYGLDCLAIPQGMARNNRIGDDIMVKKVTFKFMLQPGDHFNICRVLIATAPTANPLSSTSLVSSLLTGGPTDDVTLWLDSMACPKYVAAVGNAADQSMVPISYTVSKKVNWRVRYLSGTTQNPVNRLLYLQLHSDSAAPPHPGVYGFARVYYTDA